MILEIKQGDILDIDAEVLICSANTMLNMSGGVGGALLVRYGDCMQQWLRNYLLHRQMTSVKPGTIVQAPSCGTPYRFVLHAVAINVFYETSHALLVTIIQDALYICSNHHVKSVALTALATGFGRFPLTQFAQVLHEVMKDSYDSVEKITVCLEKTGEAEELQKALA